MADQLFSRPVVPLLRGQAGRDPAIFVRPSELRGQAPGLQRDAPDHGPAALGVRHEAGPIVQRVDAALLAAQDLGCVEEAAAGREYQEAAVCDVGVEKLVLGVWVAQYRRYVMLA